MKEKIISFDCDKYSIYVEGEKVTPYVIDCGIKGILRYEHKGKWIQIELFLFDIVDASDKSIEEIKRFANGFFNPKRNVVGERGNV